MRSPACSHQSDKLDLARLSASCPVTEPGPFDSPDWLVPAEAGGLLVIRDPALEEVLLLAEVDRLAHPRERVLRHVLAGQPDPLQPPVGDVPDVLLEQLRVQAKHAVREAVPRVGLLK